MNDILIATRGYARLSDLSIAGRGYYGGLLDKILTVVKAVLNVSGQDIGSAFPNVKVVVQMVMATAREFIINRNIRSWTISAIQKDFAARMADNDHTVEMRDTEIVIPPANRKKDEGPDVF